MPEEGLTMRADTIWCYCVSKRMTKEALHALPMACLGVPGKIVCNYVGIAIVL